MDTKIDKKLEFVLVKVENKARLRIVKTGIQDNSNIVVLSRSKVRDSVVFAPQVPVYTRAYASVIVTLIRPKNQELH